VPPRGLPGGANLEQLKNGAKSFQRAVRAGDAGAAEVVREFHPRLADAQPDSPELNAFKRADAQLVVARSFGFQSWPKLKAYLELTPQYSRAPHTQPIGQPIHVHSGGLGRALRPDGDPAIPGRARRVIATGSNDRRGRHRSNDRRGRHRIRRSSTRP